VPLIALNDAPQCGFFGRLWDSIMLWFHGSKGNTEQAPTAPSASSAPTAPSAPSAPSTTSAK